MGRRHEGFTLVELVATAAVLAVVLALALPSFRALRERHAALEAFHALTVALAGAVSSTRRAVIVTGSPGFGMTGACFTSRIIGAMLALATELARPGVPLVTVLDFQFCPSLLLSEAFTSSSELPSPSAG